MKYLDKRTADQDIEAVQSANRQWWVDHTMSYDWNDKTGLTKFSAEWYDEIDRRFIHGARLFAHDEKPFDKIIPLDRLKDLKVLEIGCGMGLHTELIARAGASVVSIDISDASIAATARRMATRGLASDVRRMDAENLEFPEGSFDLVWSWGVIHHSARTGRIVREIHRVLKPGGEARVMVYNLEGTPAYVAMVRSYLLGFWKNKSLDECLWKSTDGYSARFYTSDLLQDLFYTFFSKVSVTKYGQDADAVPLPARLRAPLLRAMQPAKVQRLANQRGAFLFAIGTK